MIENIKNKFFGNKKKQNEEDPGANDSLKCFAVNNKESTLILDNYEDKNKIIENENENKKNNNNQLIKNSNSQNSNDEKNENKTVFFYEKEYSNIKKCSSYTLGPEPINQKCYICPICDETKKKYICEFCYNECHKKCRRENNLINSKSITITSKSDESEMTQEFACYCGLKYKHNPPVILVNSIIPCYLIKLDQTLNTDSFFCESHNIPVCSICSVSCHKNCKIRKECFIEPQDSNSNNNNFNINKDSKNDGMMKCFCQNESHTSYNEVAFMFHFEDYQKACGVKVWPIQVINLLFIKKTFDKLKSLFVSTLNKEQIEDKEKKNFSPLLLLFSNIFNNKFKTFYYQDDIINMFQYESIIKYIPTIQINNSSTFLSKSRLIFVLLYIHIRKDFQTIKSLTSIDFILNTILERIIYKKILAQKSIYTEKIDKKYNLNKLMNMNHILKDIVFNDICELLDKGMDYINIETKAKEFEIGLKYICFMMKRMVFSKDELINIIFVLNKFFNKFFDRVKSDEKKLYKLIDIFDGLAELFFMISVSYNDIIVMNYLDTKDILKNKNKKKIKFEPLKDFIHVKSDHGKILFQMIIKSCELLKKHYQSIPKPTKDPEEDNNDNIKRKTQLFKKTRKVKFQAGNENKEKKNEKEGLFVEKIIRIFTETLSIFSLADNVYYDQLKSINENELNDYFRMSQCISEGFNLGGSGFNQNEIQSINQIFYKLKENIEKNFLSLFTSFYNSNTLQINSKIYDLIEKMSASLTNIFNDYSRRKGPIDLDENENENEITSHIRTNMNMKFLSNNQNEHICSDEIMQTFDEEINNNQNYPFNYFYQLKNKNNNNNNKDDDDYLKTKIIKTNNYLRKLIIKNKNNFPFIQKKSYYKLCESFIDILIISNIDETIGKILAFFSDRNCPNLLTYQLFDIICSTLSLFFFTRKGMKYFLMGKNLTRINKIINHYNTKPDDLNIDLSIGKTFQTNLQIMNRTLDFMLDFTKGMNLYDLNIKNHKIILRYKNNLLENISFLNEISAQKNCEKEFVSQFQKTIKIFINLSESFEFEDFTHIKHQCIQVFKNNPSGLFDMKKFFDYFNKKKVKILYNKRNNQINNNENNNEIYLSLYFQFFKLLSIKSFFSYNNRKENELFEHLYAFNDLEEIKKYFMENNFNLKQKIIIMNYLRSIYLIDHLSEYNIIDQENLLTNSEFSLLLNKNIIQVDDVVKENFEDQIKEPQDNNEPEEEDLGNIDLYKGKYNHIKQIEIVLEIYLSEIEKFPNQITNNDIDICKLYCINLLFDLKYISNFFYFKSKHLCSFLRIYLYKLAAAFIKQIYVFLKVYKSFKRFQSKNFRIFDTNNDIYSKIKTSDYKFKEIDERMLRIKTISLNVYSKKQIYCNLIEAINKVIKICKIKTYSNNNLENFLEDFDIMGESNFTPFSLLETWDYEYFYVDGQEEKQKIVEKNFFLSQLENLKNSYMKTFLDINNTNFLEVLTNSKGEIIIIDYEKIFVGFFQNFLNSTEGNCLHKLNILLCILTKMSFYDSEGMKGLFENYISKTFFFQNFNRILNIYIAMEFSLTKNIYAYSQVGKIINLTKLIIQFLQSLGEGFNLTYHNNIFKNQKKVIDYNDPFDSNSSDSDSNFNDDEDSFFKNKQKTIDIEENKIDLIYNEHISDINTRAKNIINLDDLKYKRIFNPKRELYIPNIKITHTIYGSIFFNLKYALYYLKKRNKIDGEIPYDKLIILVTNIIDFLIEYIASEKDKNVIIDSQFHLFLFGVGKKKKEKKYESETEHINNKKYLNVLFARLLPEKNKNKLYILRNKVYCYVKIKFIQLLIYYLLSGNKEKMVSSLMVNHCSTIEIYLEILYTFKELLENLELKNKTLIDNLNQCQTTKEYINKLIDFYAFEDDFRNMIEFPVIIKFFILIMIFEHVYNIQKLSSFFNKIDSSFQEKLLEKNENITKISSTLSYCIYKFLERIVIKVEIKMDSNESESEEKVEEFPFRTKNKNIKISRFVVDNLKSDPFYYEFMSFKNTNQFISTKSVKILKEEEKINQNENNHNEDEDNNNNKKNSLINNNIKMTFFPRPYLSFFLSETSKETFVKTVNRARLETKLISLIFFADYSLFEMIVNKHIIGSSRINKCLSNINYKIIELINYLCIVFHNYFISKHFYKSADLSFEEYEYFDEDKKRHLYSSNIIIFIIQTLFLLIFIIIWYYYKFLNTYQYNILKKYQRRFIIKCNNDEEKISQTVTDYFQEQKVSTISFFLDVNHSLSIFKKLYVLILDTNLLNREINVLVLSLILNIFYLSFKSHMFLVIQLLFVVNLIPYLFTIFQALNLKFVNIFTVILFDYIVILVFIWFAYFFIANCFYIPDILHPASQRYIQEGFCYSSLQCYLFIISVGTRSFGGIGDKMNEISYKEDPGWFIYKSFYTTIFFFLVVLFLGKIFFGIIIDAFSELRNINSNNENDKNNKCYICQITRDDCIIKSIDFDNHITNVHNLWDYVYFLVYLATNNALDFNSIENSVWEKLQDNGFNWLPIINPSN